MGIDQERQDFARWLALGRGMSSHSVRAYGHDIAALQRHLGIDATVDDISETAIREFVESQRADALAEATVVRRVAAVRSFCRWLVETHAVTTDHLLGVRITARRPHSLPRSIPDTELRRLLRWLCSSAALTERRTLAGPSRLAQPHEVTTLLGVGLMVGTGVRVGELVAVECTDIDPHSGSIRVHGKGSRQRTVYLSGRFITAVLRAYLKDREHLAVSHQYLLFTRSGAPMSTSALRARLATASRAAGLQRTVTPHMLRHTAATQLIEAGVDIRFVQRLLGHASITTTELYTHVTDKALHRMITKANVLDRHWKVDN